jgi:hypothetical protein
MNIDSARRPLREGARVAGSLFPALAGFALASCVPGDDEPPPTYTARDSAGVEVVESRICAWGASVPWTVSETAELSIGVAAGQRPYQFARVTDVLRYPDGRVAVADEGNGEVRIFRADGTHLSTVGRLGDGPGEFRSIRRILLGQDRLWVFDARRAQVSAFDDSGVLTETRPVQLSGPAAQPIGDVRLMRDGELFGIDGNTMVPGEAPALLRDTAYVFRIGGGASAPVLGIPGAWTEYRVVEGRSGFRLQPLTPVPSWDVAGSNLYHSSGERFEIIVSDTAGRARRIVRRLEPAPPTTAADLERFQAPILAEVPPEQRALAEQALAAWTVPATMPVYTDLLVDPSGNVWARRHGDELPEWDLFDARGSCRGTVRMPTGLTVHEIGEDYVLGVWSDASGVAHVRLHRLVTEAPPSGS